MFADFNISSTDLKSIQISTGPIVSSCNRIIHHPKQDESWKFDIFFNSVPIRNHITGMESLLPSSVPEVR